MKLDDVITRFHTSAMQVQTAQVPIKRAFKESAVLMPLIETNGQAALLFCKRSAYLKHHPAQVCFPGGKAEPEDVSLVATAIRETHEELGITRSKIKPIGVLNQHATLTGFSICPVVAVLPNNVQWHTQSAEVEQAFTLPLETLADQINWQNYQLQLAGQVRTLPGLMTPHGLLWGATASLVKNFIQLIKST